MDKAKAQHPDLILMDMKMPVMDGYEATRILKESKDTHDIPIVALTASVMEQSVDMIREKCDGYLAKPVSKTGLVQELMRHLDHGVEEKEEVEAHPAEDYVALTPETLARLPELIELLEGHRHQCAEFRESQTINHIEAFGTLMKTTGAEFGYPALKKWGADLEMQAQLFDMESMNRTLDDFEALIETMRIHAETQGD